MKGAFRASDREPELTQLDRHAHIKNAIASCNSFQDSKAGPGP